MTAYLNGDQRRCAEYGPGRKVVALSYTRLSRRADFVDHEPNALPFGFGSLITAQTFKRSWRTVPRSWCTLTFNYISSPLYDVTFYSPGEILESRSVSSAIKPSRPHDICSVPAAGSSTCFALVFGVIVSRRALTGLSIYMSRFRTCTELYGMADKDYSWYEVDSCAIGLLSFVSMVCGPCMRFRIVFKHSRSRAPELI
jgi:hypothetical protein